MKKTLSLIIALALTSFAYSGHHKNSEKTPQEVVTAAYATFASGDTEGWAALHTDDLKFTITGKLPHSGVFIGTQDVIEGVFTKIPTLWPDFKLTPIRTDVIGNTVYVHNKMIAGKLESLSMHMFRLRDGKIASFTAFDDTDTMRQTMTTE